MRISERIKSASNLANLEKNANKLLPMAGEIVENIPGFLKNVTPKVKNLPDPGTMRNVTPPGTMRNVTPRAIADSPRGRGFLSRITPNQAFAASMAGAGLAGGGIGAFINSGSGYDDAMRDAELMMRNRQDQYEKIIYDLRDRGLIDRIMNTGF
jgi:hypothetical protein